MTFLATKDTSKSTEIVAKDLWLRLLVTSKRAVGQTVIRPSIMTGFAIVLANRCHHCWQAISSLGSKTVAKAKAKLTFLYALARNFKQLLFFFFAVSGGCK